MESRPNMLAAVAAAVGTLYHFFYSTPMAFPSLCASEFFFFYLFAMFDHQMNKSNKSKF